VAYDDRCTDTPTRGDDQHRQSSTRQLTNVENETNASLDRLTSKSTVEPPETRVQAPRNHAGIRRRAGVRTRTEASRGL